MPAKRVFKKIHCVCGRDIGKNAIKRHRTLCSAYWKNRALRAERGRRATGTEIVLPRTQDVLVPMRMGNEEEE